MNALKLKVFASLAGTAAVILPPATYKAADIYMRSYNTASAYLGDTIDSGLSIAGLTTIKDLENVDSLIEANAIRYHLQPKLLKALIHTESRANSDAYSIKGAIGLAQIMPANAKRCGLNKVSKLWADEINIQCGAQILSEELKTYKGNLHKALMAYNGGPKCITNKCSESVNYAQNIMMQFAQENL